MIVGARCRSVPGPAIRRNVARVRSDGDSWDITTSVGSTALFVAAARAREGAKPAPLSRDRFAEAFCRAAGGPWPAMATGQDPESPLETSDFGAAFVNFQGARTRFFDDYFGRAAGARVRQVVILAAGLDSRAYRLDWPADTVVYELDLPSVLAFKDEVLAAASAQPTARRVEVAVDLRKDWPAALRAQGFDPGRPAAFIAEGLLIYLTAAAQRRLCEGIDALAAPGSWVAVEDGSPMPEQDFAAARAVTPAGPTSEFFHLIYNEQHQPSQDWFGEHGWDATATPLAEYLRASGRPVPPESEGGDMVARTTLVVATKG